MKPSFPSLQHIFFYKTFLFLASVLVFLVQPSLLFSAKTSAYFEDETKQKHPLVLKGKVVVSSCTPSLKDFFFNVPSVDFPASFETIKWPHRFTKAKTYLLKEEIVAVLKQKLSTKNVDLLGEGILVCYQKNPLVKITKQDATTSVENSSKKPLKGFFNSSPENAPKVLFVKKVPFPLADQPANSFEKQQQTIRYVFDAAFENKKTIRKGTPLKMRYQLGNTFIETQAVLQDAFANKKGMGKKIKIKNVSSQKIMLVHAIMGVNIVFE